MTLPLIPLVVHALMIQIVDKHCVHRVVTGADLVAPSGILSMTSETRRLQRQA
jgi:predicted ribosome-associated RNA-binding protein Tma20